MLIYRKTLAKKQIDRIVMCKYKYNGRKETGCNFRDKLETFYRAPIVFQSFSDITEATSQACKIDAECLRNNKINLEKSSFQSMMNKHLH